VRVHLPDTSVSIALSPADEYLLSPRLVAQHRASAYAQPCQHRVTMQEGGGRFSIANDTLPRAEAHGVIRKNSALSGTWASVGFDGPKRCHSQRQIFRFEDFLAHRFAEQKALEFVAVERS
jgi:hypothetical protein